MTIISPLLSSSLPHLFLVVKILAACFSRSLYSKGFLTQRSIVLTNASLSP
ncbi:unnamed protein product [Chondrus crispus]|uniref:Uncharacterized protein n=1 Tax=Chondrus crispus TaxID=2769 RepID=R7QU59_CHOCR|nr:unnamed protein product [Chondrus crispus]CDF40996.1 unnamed protein product [Chondrus crispus]|eukprot:XP_005711290.1 unnamed protein product [Chondrus crispus]